MKTYAVKEVFYSLQGEGANAGRPAVFCRFSGCNLWSGREADRHSATCKFCDTDFVGGERLSADEITRRAGALWPTGAWTLPRFAVLTGGEPALQVDRALIGALHREGFEVAIETNGTVELPTGIDWTTVSPKAGTELKVQVGCELKFVYPQAGAEPWRYAGLNFRHFYLQPMDGPDVGRNTQAAVAYCLENPRWRLSVQTHKALGLR